MRWVATLPSESRDTRAPQGRGVLRFGTAHVTGAHHIGRQRSITGEERKSDAER